jgi:hypothetical protein
MTFQAQAGGGIYAHNSGGKIINNKIIDNHVEDDNIAGGAGISFITFVNDVWAVIDNNAIKNNTALAHDFSAFGGGMAITSNAIIRNNTISNNIITNTNESEGADGGGIELEHMLGTTVPEVIIKNNLIHNNEVNGVNYAIGGGINSYGVPATLTGNTFTYNQVNADFYTHGGAIYFNSCGDGGTVKNNVVEHNSCISDYAYGAGIRSWNGGNQLFEDNLINNNTIIGNEVALGGGVYVNEPSDSIKIIRNTITDNGLVGSNTFGSGIGIYKCFDFGVLISRNLVKNCTADYGGGLFLYNSFNTVICNNLFMANDASVNGGAMFFRYVEDDKYFTIEEKSREVYHPLVVNNTIFNNTAWNGGAVYTDYDAEIPIFLNTLFWSNEATNNFDEIYNGSPDTLTIAYCNINTDEISGSWKGNGNIFKNPHFEDDTCHLGWQSNCIDKGVETFEAFGNTYTCPEYDYDGEPRPQCELVDIGADESPYGVGIEEFQVTGCRLQVYPNPVKEISNFQYTISNFQFITLQVLNVHGEVIKSLVGEVQRKGEYTVQFDASGLPAGVYFVRLNTDEERITEKFLVVN